MYNFTTKEYNEAIPVSQEEDVIDKYSILIASKSTTVNELYKIGGNNGDSSDKIYKLVFKEEN